MAKATKNERTERVVVTETSYTLELSQKEAEFLRTMLSAVGGSPTNSPREHEYAITEALRDAGVPSYEKTDAYKLQSGQIMFDDYTQPF